MTSVFTFFSRTSFFHYYLSSLKFRLVKSINSIHSFGFILHFNETKTL